MTTAFRWLTLSLLMIALWNPKIGWKSSPIDVYLVLDDSQSMKHRVDQKVWSMVRQDLQKLPSGSRIALIRYGKTTVIENKLSSIEKQSIRRLLNSNRPPRIQPLDRSGSNLEQALNFTLRLVQPNRTSCILIIHDGQQTHGNATSLLNAIQKRSYSLYEIRINHQNDAKDAWIRTISAPLSAASNQAISVSVTTQANHKTSGVLQFFINDKFQKEFPIALKPGTNATTRLVTDACPPGICLINTIIKTAQDSSSENNSQSTVVTVAGRQTIGYFTATDRITPVLASLQLGKYPVERLRTDLCEQTPQHLEYFGVIILDDINTRMMRDSCWAAIYQAVSRHGVGLVVLGGPNSFSAGGYRHSILEDLLPVISEASRPQPSAAILFVIDKSGSMDIDNSRRSRIALAREAMIESLKSHQQNELIGLISFDTKAKLRVPLKRHAEAVAIIEENLNLIASGGTLLGPALDLAIEQFASVNSKKRILILVTDGFLDEAEISAIEQKIIEQKIDIISMAIGDSVKTESLQRLSRATNGRFLRVDKVAELPHLMRNEIEQRRNPIEIQNSTVDQILQVPFVSPTNRWPVWPNYPVTRAKPDSKTYLISQKGDPLLASNFAGAGTVVAIPAGLDNWATNWVEWTQWGKFLGGLVNWTSNRWHNPRLDVSLVQTADKIFIQVDHTSSKSDWSTGQSGTVTIHYPSGLTETKALQVEASGRFSADIPVSIAGVHRLTVRIGDDSMQFGFNHSDIAEFLPAADDASITSSVNVSPWPETGIANNLKNQHKLSVRSEILGLALIVYLLTIITEKFSFFGSVKQLQRNHST